MPTTVAENTALLDMMSSDHMDESDLKSIELHSLSSRRMQSDGACVEERVTTARGDLLVAVRGDRSKRAIITYHDLGLNYVSNFQAFFNYTDMRTLVEKFCIYHINAPGQEEGAPSLPEDYVYPSMEELAHQIGHVLCHFGIKSFIGFGVGAGANILTRFAIENPQKVDALVLINCTSTQAGWTEWLYQKINTRQLRSNGMTQGALDYLMWHHFGRSSEDRNHDLARVYKDCFANVNPINLSMLIDAYIRRSDLGISRDNNTIKVAVLNVTGALSPHVDDTVTFNGRLDPKKTSWLNISDSGMVLEEQPGKIAEAFKLFLQGEGYCRLSGLDIKALSRYSFWVPKKSGHKYGDNVRNPRPNTVIRLRRSFWFGRSQSFGHRRSQK
ncbi:Protein NDRG3 [Eumeta japonica]|uniref:Protein NDRG3 n=1 Tax=Eumeta variegata TaxID=151549 RepID=A0A4C1WCY3_EUMVA|nr:Protein NDRG3 [Eumeta japonica]